MINPYESPKLIDQRRWQPPKGVLRGIAMLSMVTPMVVFLLTLGDLRFTYGGATDFDAPTLAAWLLGAGLIFMAVSFFGAWAVANWIAVGYSMIAFFLWVVSSILAYHSFAGY